MIWIAAALGWSGPADQIHKAGPYVYRARLDVECVDGDVVVDLWTGDGLRRPEITVQAGRAVTMPAEAWGHRGAYRLDPKRSRAVAEAMTKSGALWFSFHPAGSKRASVRIANEGPQLAALLAACKK